MITITEWWRTLESIRFVRPESVVDVLIINMSSPPNERKEPLSSNKRTGEKGSNNEKEDIVHETLVRLTKGIPKQELRLYISEAKECEEAIKKDIEALEKVLKEGDNPGSSAVVDEMIESPFTPLDRFWTASALLGRLRGVMAPPSLFHDPNRANSKATAKLAVPNGAKTSQEAQQLLDLLNHPAYTRTESAANILVCWKKIFSNRAAVVFKKPVKDEEAPGYSERIQFPMDLSLVRKMIVTRHISNFQQLHSYIGLIAHNCVKYNGRETDYGIVARDFETMADEIIRQAVLNADSMSQVSAVPASSSSTATVTAGARRPGSTNPVTASSDASTTMKREASSALNTSLSTAAPLMVSEDSTSNPSTQP